MQKLALILALVMMMGCSDTPSPQLTLPDSKPSPDKPDPNPQPQPAPAPKQNVIYVKSDEDFQKIKNERSGNNYVGYFYADWCPPCKEIKRRGTIEALGSQNPDIVFLKINTDLCPQTTRGYNVRSLPTLIAAKQYFVGSGQITVDNVQKVINEKRLEVLKGSASTSR